MFGHFDARTDPQVLCLPSLYLLCLPSLYGAPHSTEVASRNKTHQYYLTSVLPRDHLTALNYFAQSSHTNNSGSFFAAFSHRISEIPEYRFCSRRPVLCPTINVARRAITANAASIVVPTTIVSFQGV